MPETLFGQKYVTLLKCRLRPSHSYLLHEWRRRQTIPLNLNFCVLYVRKTCFERIGLYFRRHLGSLRGFIWNRTAEVKRCCIPFRLDSCCAFRSLGNQDVHSSSLVCNFTITGLTSCLLTREASSKILYNNADFQS